MSNLRILFVTSKRRDKPTSSHTAQEEEKEESWNRLRHSRGEHTRGLQHTNASLRQSPKISRSVFPPMSEKILAGCQSPLLGTARFRALLVLETLLLANVDCATQRLGSRAARDVVGDPERWVMDTVSPCNAPR